MNLDDYIKKVEETKKYERPRWALYFKNIDSYNLQPEKVNLIKEYYKYLKAIPLSHTFWDSYWINYTAASRDKFMLQQTETQTGNRMAVLIDIVELNIDGVITISEEEKQKRINYFKQVGLQQFRYTNILSDYDISKIIKRETPYFGGYHLSGYIFYSSDDYIFISDELAQAIRIIDTDRIGNILAEEVYKLKKNLNFHQIPHHKKQKKYPF